eukprot:3549422-Alexandrium_andersonii.AAC.1
MLQTAASDVHPLSLGPQRPPSLAKMELARGGGDASTSRGWELGDRTEAPQSAGPGAREAQRFARRLWPLGARG